MKLFTSLLFLLFFCFPIVAQQQKSTKSLSGKTYIKTPPVKSTAKKTFNLPAPSHFRNTEKAFTFNGQWKGGFVDNSASFIGLGGEKIDYVLELESRGTEVTGYSYTYFTEGAKRYYTICKLRGTINLNTKEIVVTEYERTKYNTPPDMSNCFQTHKLKYVKENADTEMIQGSWVPAPNQSGNCGYGRTSLARRIVKRTTANEQQAYVPPVKKPSPESQSIAKQNKPLTKDQNKTKVPSRPTLIKNNSELKKNTSQKKDTLKTEISITKPSLKKEDQTITSNLKFDQRINTVLKTIPIKNETFTVDFYDNGEIDGDSISVFYNGTLVLSHKRLTNKPLTLTLTIDPDKEINELVMYAENLGEIPPNTALMIVNDRDNRYEARITSDTQKNGTIRFSYKPN